MGAGLAFSPMALVLITGCASVCFAALALALALGRSGAPRLDDRVKAVAGTNPSWQRTPAKADESRRRLVEETLREIEARERAKTRGSPRPTLVGRMRQAGIAWNRMTYLLISATLGTIAYAAASVVFGLDLAPSLAMGVTVGLLMPHLYVSHKRNRRLNAFSAEFPNALDQIIRGVQAGLSLGDCLEIVAKESQEPVCREFATLMQDQTLGVPLDEAVERLFTRIPLPEANFFAIVIAIQSRTGGNLAEALSNLSKVLRDRHAMRAKIKAVSAEAKASAGIIGCMPLVVSVLIYFSSPDYIALLFTSSTGHIALAGSAVWMTIGTLLMRKMINFDF